MDELRKCMDGYLQRDVDRALFELAPRETAEQGEAQVQAIEA